MGSCEAFAVFCGTLGVLGGPAAGVCGCAVGGLDRSDWARLGSMIFLCLRVDDVEFREMG